MTRRRDHIFRPLEQVAVVVMAMTPLVARAQDTSAPAKPEERTTGLPSKVDWKFNFDAAWGSFGFGNSLYHKNVTASVVAAFADPRAGVQQATGRTQHFKYGMVFIAYSY